MAGDWIKLEAVTPDKPEIYGIAERLGCSHGDAFLACVRFWIWVDQQSLKGNALAVTKNAIDRITGLQKFGDALEDVGWLRDENFRCSLPNFERHNGKTSKTRALTAKRVAEYKSRQGNDLGVTSALPREEKSKRREKKETNPPYPPSGGFERFWKAWPKSTRKGSKGECESLWRKHHLESVAEQILAHVEHMKLSLDWRKENGQYIPGVAKYLRHHVWEGAELSEQQRERRAVV